ncbi:hypothetical protein ABBQ38_005291 [Trebouxia sp. C0009 RCD-2024]
MAACLAIFVHKADLRCSSHMTELAAGIANLIIGMQCQGSIVLWLLASVLSLWSPSEDSHLAQQQRPLHTGAAAVSSGASSLPPDQPDMLGQALPLYSMMRQVGIAMLRHKASCNDAAMEMIALLSSASNSGHWQEGMTSVLAAGGLLEGLARGTAALAPASPACQALSHILTQVCTRSQAPTAQSSLCIGPSAVSDSSSDRAGCSADATLLPPSGHPPLQPQDGTAMQQGAAAVACCQTWQACRMPPPAGPVAACLMATLWGSCLTLEGLFQASALGQPAEEGDAWLQRHVGGRLMQEAATMARIAAELYRLVDEQSQQACRELLQQGVQRLFEGYRAYATTTTPAWMQAVDAAAVRQVLDKAFMSGVLVMTAFWATAVARHLPDPPPPSDKTVKASNSKPWQSRSTASAADLQPASSMSPSAAARGVADAVEGSAQTSDSLSGSPAQPDSSSSMVAVHVLNSLSYLQFCRMRLTAYNTLLKAVLAPVSASAQATQQLSDELPSYAEVTKAAAAPYQTQHSEAHGKQAALWLRDSILATRVQFLMTVLGPCLPALSQGDACLQAAPLMFLYMQHPHKPLPAAAHGLFCAVIQQTNQKEQLVPFYMERALEGYPSCTPIIGLSAGVDAAMRELPSGSPVVLYMFRSLAKHTHSLLQQGTDKQARYQDGLDLLRLLSQMLLVVEFQFLSDALDTVEQLVLDSDIALQTQVSACTCIYEVLSTSDDYTRKVRCAHWYQKLASRCGPIGRQTSLRGAEELTHLLLSNSPLP